MRQILILEVKIEEKLVVQTDQYGQSHMVPEKVSSKVAVRNGLFHGWTHMEEPRAIIELPSGEIELVHYSFVRFV